MGKYFPELLRSPFTVAALITRGRGETVRFADANRTNVLPDTRSWVRAQFIQNHHLLEWRPAMESHNGLDLMLLLAWVVQKFPENEPFVIHYWDLRPWNILIDAETHDLKAYFPPRTLSNLQTVSLIGIM